MFVPAIDYYGELESRRREVRLRGRPCWVLGPEDLVVLKLMFYRRKDLADVESLLREQRATLDLQFIEAKLRELSDGDEERLETLREIAADVDKD